MAEQEQPRTFMHAGWRFIRNPDGMVDINIYTAYTPPQGLRVTPETWASIVASMGEGGETLTNWRAALAFHQDAHSHGEPTILRAMRSQVIAALDAWAQARLEMNAAYEQQDRSVKHGSALHRALVACYDAEERLIDLRGILAALEARHEASRTQPQAAEQTEVDQGDPGDEQPTVFVGAGDTSPHSVPLADVVAARQAIAATREIAAPAAYVAATADSRTTLLTQPNVTGIAPASLHRLASLAAGDGDLAGLQGWFGRHAQVFSMAYRHADRQDNQEWRTQARVALHDYLTTGTDLLPALRNLARQVLARHGQITPGEAL